MGITNTFDTNDLGKTDIEIWSNGTQSHPLHPDTISEDYWHSEGFVIQNRNDTISYGLDITLGNFTGNERAVIELCLTPGNNNSLDTTKRIVLDLNSKELKESNDGTARFVIDVPDGFTKFVVAPISTENEIKDDKSSHGATKNSESSFTIKKINFTDPTVTRSGTLEITDQGADGAVYEDFAWDWAAVKTYLATGVLVETKLTPDLSQNVLYNVDLAYSTDHKTVRLILKDGATKVPNTDPNHKGEFVAGPNLNGKELFTATLDERGNWKIDQTFRFTLADGSDPTECPFQFILTDGDGSVTPVEHTVDLTLSPKSERFDNVENGYYDKEEWGSIAYNDNSYDVLEGHGTNDLMYGRGGNDIMFGDKLDENNDQSGFKEFAKTVLGKEFGYKVYDNDKTGEVDKTEEGANKELSENIFNAIKDNVDKSLSDNEAIREEALNKLDEIVEKAEGINGGDDALFGGVGDDILFGGAGNDYLVGTGNLADSRDPNTNDNPYTDVNMLFGGSGNDILVYNASDIIEDGGKDVDFLLVGNKVEESLQTLLNSGGQDGKPVVRNIEVMVKTDKYEDPASIGVTSLDSLASFGIIMAGDNQLVLDSNIWQPVKADEGDAAQSATKFVPKEGTDAHEKELSVEVIEGLDVKFADVIGGKSADTLEASDDGSVIYAMGGNDKINGKDGDDYIDGGEGHDTIHAGSGNDIIRYDANDTIDGGEGTDLLVAGRDAANLGDILAGDNVSSIEVLLKTDAAGNLTSHEDLAEKAGVLIQDGKLALDDTKWNINSITGEGIITIESTDGESEIQYDGSKIGMTHVNAEEFKDFIQNGIPEQQPAEETSLQIPDGSEGFTQDIDGDPTGPALLAVERQDSDLSADQPVDRMIFGDGANRQGEITEEIATEKFYQIMSMDAEQNRQFGELVEGDRNIEASSDNNDVITGGMGNELIFAMGGDDYIDGGEGVDSIFAGSGNDIIRYDENDVAINGGSGIDLIIAGEDSPSLEKLLEGPADDDSPQPIVNNVELMLKVDKETEEELNIRNMADVAALGIVVAGNEIVVDTSKWEPIVQESPSGKTVSFAGKTESGHKMILEVAKEGEHKLFTQTSGDKGDNLLEGDELANIMHGMDGDDQLFGGLGDDKLFGDKGDDYLDGGEGRDWIEGGEGNDIIMLDPSDYLIDGGDDEIDFILSTDKNASLAQMLENGANPDSAAETPMVRDVEVLVSGNVDNIKSVQDLADKGIDLNETKTGISLSKDSGWKKYEDKTSDNQDDSAGKSSASTTHKYYNEDYDLVVETTVPVDDDDFDVYVPAEKPAASVADAAVNTGADIVPSDETGPMTENRTEEENQPAIENQPADESGAGTTGSENKSEENRPEDSKTENVRPEEDGKTADGQTDGEENETRQTGTDDDSDKDHENKNDLPEKNENVAESENQDDSGPANENKPVAKEPNTEEPADEILKGKEEGKEPTTPQKSSGITENGDTDTGSDKETPRNEEKGEEDTLETGPEDAVRAEKEDGDTPAKDSGKGSASEQSTNKGSDSHELPTTSGPAEADIMPPSDPADHSIMDQIAAATNQVLADSGNGLG